MLAHRHAARRGCVAGSGWDLTLPVLARSAERELPSWTLPCLGLERACASWHEAKQRFGRERYGHMAVGATRFAWLSAEQVSLMSMSNSASQDALIRPPLQNDDIAFDVAGSPSTDPVLAYNFAQSQRNGSPWIVRCLLQGHSIRYCRQCLSGQPCHLFSGSRRPRWVTPG